MRDRFVVVGEAVGVSLTSVSLVKCTVYGDKRAREAMPLVLAVFASRWVSTATVGMKRSRL